MVQDESIGFVLRNGIRSQIIVHCVRWYLSYKLSSRDLVQVMAERGIELTHTTILRGCTADTPEFQYFGASK